MEGCCINCGEEGNWCKCDGAPYPELELYEDYVDLREDCDIGGEG